MTAPKTPWMAVYPEWRSWCRPPIWCDMHCGWQSLVHWFLYFTRSPRLWLWNVDVLFVMMSAHWCSLTSRFLSSVHIWRHCGWVGYHFASRAFYVHGKSLASLMSVIACINLTWSICNIECVSVIWEIMSSCKKAMPHLRHARKQTPPLTIRFRMAR